MDYKILSKFSGTLFGLAFFTSLICSFLFTKIIGDNFFDKILAIDLTCFCVVFLFLYFFSNTETSGSVGVYLFISILDIIGAIVLFFLNDNFHLTASYLNRFAVYSIILIPMFLTVAVFWTYLTRFVFGDLISNTTFDISQERLLYVFISLLCALFLAAAIPYTTYSTFKGLRKAGFVNSIGIWFLNGFIFAGIGYSILTKFSTLTGIGTPINTNATYEGVN